MKKTAKKTAFRLLCLFAVAAAQPSFSQEEWNFQSEAERPISPAYRIAENPTAIDTVIPVPDIDYPLLAKKMETATSLQAIEASRIKLVDKTAPLYPGYVKVGMGNYISPLAELYYNASRGERLNYGAHLRHHASWGQIRGWAPSSFDHTTAALFGAWKVDRWRLRADVDYLNHGYHFYGIPDADLPPAGDSLRNRVQGIGGRFQLAPANERGAFHWQVQLGQHYFHEFQPNWISSDRRARNYHLQLGGKLRYAVKNTVYTLNVDGGYVRYNYAKDDLSLAPEERFDEHNTNLHLRPCARVQGKRWELVYGLDATLDLPRQDGGGNLLKLVPVAEGSYRFVDDVIVAYAGVDGGVTQQSFYTLNRLNPYLYAGTKLLDERLIDLYAGVKGRLSNVLTFGLSAHLKDRRNTPLFVNLNAPQANGTIHVDRNRFEVRYDAVRSYGVEGHLAYHNGEKWKIDALLRYSHYRSQDELHAWHLPSFESVLSVRCKVIDRLYAKADFALELGRISPVYLFNQADDQIAAYMQPIADGNIEVEYEYTDRLSFFVQFNNIANRCYDRWYRYQVQGFQLMGGLTFGF